MIHFELIFVTGVRYVISICIVYLGVNSQKWIFRVRGLCNFDCNRYYQNACSENVLILYFCIIKTWVENFTHIPTINCYYHFFSVWWVWKDISVLLLFPWLLVEFENIFYIWQPFMLSLLLIYFCIYWGFYSLFFYCQFVRTLYIL